MPDAEEYKRQDVEQDDEYRQLATRHSELDGRLQQLTARPHLSDAEQLEEATLKKRKLQLKDQMQTIARHHGPSNGTAFFA